MTKKVLTPSVQNEVKRIIEKLLEIESFQIALNEASLQISIHDTDLETLIEFLPENKRETITIDTLQEALKNYRADIIVETRYLLDQLVKRETEPYQKLLENLEFPKSELQEIP